MHQTIFASKYNVRDVAFVLLSSSPIELHLLHRAELPNSLRRAVRDSCAALLIDSRVRYRGAVLETTLAEPNALKMQIGDRSLLMCCPQDDDKIWQLIETKVESPLSVPVVSSEELCDRLTVAGLDCECGLDRPWMQGEMLPHNWDPELESLAYKALGFDPQSPMVMAEMRRILAKAALVLASRISSRRKGDVERPALRIY